MSTVNFNDSTPAPPAGATNLKWQYDASGNISGYWPAAGPALSWTPTASSSGGQTATIAGVTYANYVQIGVLTWFAFYVSVTVGGTVSAAAVNVSLPVPAAASVQGLVGLSSTNGELVYATATGSNLEIERTGAQSWTAFTYAYAFTGFYRNT